MYKKYTRTVCSPPGCLQQILRIMKITTFILFFALMQVSAATLAQRVTLADKTTTLKQLFSEINKQTGYNVVWSSDQVNGDRVVLAGFLDVPLLEVLNKTLEGANLTYAIEDKTIVVKGKVTSVLDRLKGVLHMALTINGKVQDELGKPLPGVTVRVKGTTQATTTDANGLFSLSISDNNPATIITFSFVGYETQELQAKEINNGTTITLKASITNLKEVVVSKGYYNTTQELNTGNVTRIDGADIAKQPGVDPIAALEGRVPGLYIQQTSGIPGANEAVRLRGQNSLQNGNDPLYIVDGVPFSSTTLTSPNIGGGAVGGPTANHASSTPLVAGGLSPFNILDPSNIESIEILKDADATAIYGSRGANGVILITTKKGKAGKTIANVNASQGAARVASTLDLMNTQQYLAMRRKAFANDGLAVPSITTTPANGIYDVNGAWDQSRYTDWQKLLVGGTAQYTNLQGAISGGTANTQFNLGGLYRRQTTVFPGKYVDQLGSAHFNLNHSSADHKFHTTFSAQYGYDSNVIPKTDFTNYILLAPDAPAIYNADGNLNWAIGPNGTSTFNNPFGPTLITAKSATDNLGSNLVLSYELLPGLQLKTSIGFSRSEMDQTIQQPGSAFYQPTPTLRQNSLAISKSSTLIFEPQINYQKQIGKSKLDALVGMTQQENQNNSIAYLAQGFTNDALIANPSFASTFTLLGSNLVTNYRYAAIYGRLNYNWDDKYVINLTARRDGSSRFGPGREFGNFGAIGAAWIFSKEKWVDDFSWLSFGKLRASYGITGNDQIGDYQYLSTYSAYYIPYQGVNTIYPTSLSNANYAWEVNKKLEGGLDLGFLKDRIYLTVDYFRNRSGNQLVGYTLPYQTGFVSVIANLPAVVQNTGLEFDLHITITKGKSFTWTTALNLTVPRSKLISYPDLAESSNRFNYTIGKPLNTPYLYHFTGLDPQTGLYTVADLNGDGKIDNSDLQALKTIGQNYYGGLNNSFSYKGLQLDVFLQFVKQTGKNYLGAFGAPGFLFNRNFPVSFLNAWSNPGDATAVQRYSTTGTAASNANSNFLKSDASITDASFIRLKNVQLSYRLPNTWQRHMHVQNFRVFIQGQNLLTITKYQGLDPENQGITALPPLRMLSAGLEIGL